MTLRDEQREATRRRILDAAVDLLIQRGHTALTTVAVQGTAGVSRGALLHHFPTMQRLFEAITVHLIAGNETAVRQWMQKLPPELDPVARAVSALYQVFSLPAFHAELELWSVARTDPEVRNALREAESRGGRDLRRVLDEIFGPEIVALPSYAAVSEITVMLIRGLGVSQSLRSSDRAAQTLIDQWASLATRLLDDDRHHTSQPSPTTTHAPASSKESP